MRTILSLLILSLAIPAFAGNDADSAYKCTKIIEEFMAGKPYHQAFPLSLDFADPGLTFFDEQGNHYTLRQKTDSKDLNLAEVAAANTIYNLEMVIGGHLPMVFVDMKNHTGTNSPRQCYAMSLVPEELLPKVSS